MPLETTSPNQAAQCNCERILYNDMDTFKKTHVRKPLDLGGCERPGFHTKEVGKPGGVKLREYTSEMQDLGSE